MTSDGPRIVLVVNTDARDEGDLGVVGSVLRRAGLDVSIAYGLSDLEISVKNGEVDLAVVDRSLADAARAMPRHVDAWGGRPRVVSIDLFRPAQGPPPSWATAHVVYGNAEQLADELGTIALDWRIDQA